MVEKIISGGQTGVDRAALDVSIELGIPCGGWCPKGRRSEEGPIPAHYPLLETSSSEYPERTEWNIRDSDGTLVLTYGTPNDGTAITLETAKRKKKPLLIIDLQGPTQSSILESWIDKCAVRVLNVAGPRESKIPGIYERAWRFLMRALANGDC